MNREQIDRDLDTAMNSHSNPAYMAAARALWPEALFALREVQGAGDTLADAAHDYIVAFVKGEGVDQAANRLALMTQVYRTLRGMEP